MHQHNALFIIAGNRKEYQQWVKKQLINRSALCSKTMLYVEGPHTLLGWTDISGYFVGSFRDREDIEEILNRLDATNSKSIGYYSELLRR